MLLQTPGLGLRRDIQRSVILRRLNEVLPPSGFILNALARFDPLPQIDGPGVRGVPAPTTRIGRDPEVRRATRSVVRVLGTACGLGVEGSGWIARPGVVVTNAHVVAGESDTSCSCAAPARACAARAVLFDRHDDIAVLRVGGLGAPPLPLAPEPPAGRSVAVLGFPHNGPFDVRARAAGRHRAGHLRRTPTGMARCAARSSASAAGCARATRAGRWSMRRGRVVGHGVRRGDRRGPPGRLRGPGRRRARRLSAAGDHRVSHRPVRRLDARAGCYAPRTVGKTLVIAEKPSVGRDLARVLPGPFEKKSGAGEKTERSLEGPEHVITWAVGHLVQLAEPDEYDDKFKKWRMADLPIVPDRFKLIVRDERSQKQMTVVRGRCAATTSTSSSTPATPAARAS